MKRFNEFIKEEKGGEWKHLNPFEARKQGYSTSSKFDIFVNENGEDYIEILKDTLRSKAKGSSRLRDSSKTKWIVDVKYYENKNDRNPDKIVSKTIANAESNEARERKAKAAKSIINKVKKEHGADVSSAFTGEMM